MMILFVSACSNGETSESETDIQEEAVETAESESKSNDDLTELEKENEELRKELAEKEKEKAGESVADEAALDDEQDESEEFSLVEEKTASAVQEFTLKEQQEMNQLFYGWTVERAKIGNMAVTEMYFNHVAAGRGDWYAMTPNGEVQTQNQDNPGFNHFDIHAIGGVAFYQPASGDFGEDANAPFPGTAEGYSRLALSDTNIHKYMLADNGVVYELIGKKGHMGFSSGFGE